MALELVAIHRRDATHQTVGRSVLNEVIKFAPLSLCGEHKRAVLNKGTLVDEIFDVFTRSAMSALSATFHRCGPSRIETDRVALDHLCKVRSIKPKRSRRRDLLGGFSCVVLCLAACVD